MKCRAESVYSEQLGKISGIPLPLRSYIDPEQPGNKNPFFFLMMLGSC